MWAFQVFLHVKMIVVGGGQECLRHCPSNHRQWRNHVKLVSLLLLKAFLRHKLCRGARIRGKDQQVYLCEFLPLEACAYITCVKVRAVSAQYRCFPQICATLVLHQDAQGLQQVWEEREACI